MTEVIKDIKGWEGRYTISDLGIVRSLVSNKIMKPSVTKFGYLRINLRYPNCRRFKSYFIHRLVAMNFIPNPDNHKEINHIDGDKHNNTIDNLEWCSRKENEQHAFKLGLNSNKGMKNPRAKLTNKDVERIKYLYYKENYSYKELAFLFNVTRCSIVNIIKGRTWSDN